MYIIIDATVLEVRDIPDYYRLCERLHSPLESNEYISMKHGVDPDKMVLTEELVRGRRFVIPTTRESIIIGCSKQVQDLIGIQYEAWENHEKAFERMRSDYVRRIVQLEKELKLRKDAWSVLKLQYQQWLRTDFYRFWSKIDGRIIERQ